MTFTEPWKLFSSACMVSITHNINGELTEYHSFTSKGLGMFASREVADIAKSYLEKEHPDARVGVHTCSIWDSLDAFLLYQYEHKEELQESCKKELSEIEEFLNEHQEEMQDLGFVITKTPHIKETD